MSAALAGDRGPGRRGKPVRRLGRLAFDIASPIALYYLLRSQGASNLVALSVGAVVPAISAMVTLVVRRRPEPVAILMVASMALALLVSLVSHDARFLLAKDGVLTGCWGVWFVLSARGQRPAALVFARPLMEFVPWLGNRDWDELWTNEPRFRRIWRVASVMWGMGLLLDAAGRVVISYTLPIAAVPALGGLLYPVTFLVLQVITNIYYTRTGLFALLGASWALSRSAKNAGPAQRTADDGVLPTTTGST